MILYLHGFTSSPQSAKSRSLAARLATLGLADRLLCPQLCASPADAIVLAESLIDKVGAGGTASAGSAACMGAAITLVGSSLGGFYATYLAEKHGLKAVLINPAVVAAIQLERYLGQQTWLYTGETFEFTRDHIDELRALQITQLADPTRYWLLAEEGDEILDTRQAVVRYAGARQTVLPGGDHSFTRWDDYLDEIIDFAGLT